MIKYVVLCQPDNVFAAIVDDPYVVVLDEEETAIWWAEAFPNDLVMVFEVVLVS